MVCMFLKKVNCFKQNAHKTQSVELDSKIDTYAIYIYDAGFHRLLYNGGLKNQVYQFVFAET